MAQKNQPEPFHPLGDSSSDRPLPDNVEVEKLVLASTFTDKDALSTVMGSISEEDFNLNKHRIIFQRVLSLYTLGIAVDRVTLAESLIASGQLESVDGLSYLSSMDEGMPVISNLADYIKILKVKAKLRALIALAQNILNNAMSPGAEPAIIVEDLDRQVYRTFAIAEKSRIEKISDYIDRTPINKLMNTKMAGEGIYSGYRELDAITDGIHEGETIVYGAATSVGKSSVAIQIATYNALKGYPVLIYSPEMNKQTIYNRLISQYAEVPVIRFIANALNQQERERVREANAFIYDLPIYFDDSSQLKPSMVMMGNKRSKEYYGVRLGIVDYLQKMRPDFARGQQLDKLTEICDSMVVITKETFPMVVLSQLSREHRKLKAKPSLEDLKGGAVIEEMAQVVVLIHRPEMDSGKNDPTLKGKAEFIVAKNRNSQLRNIQMRYIGWQMAFKDMEEPQQALDY